jgi:uncharacterized repeat protein (TIGR03803 family)
MLDVAAIRRQALSWIGLLALCAGAHPAHGIDTYGPAVDELQIPALRIGAATYSNVVLTIGSVVSGPGGSAPDAAQDSYTPANQQLTVPAVRVGATTYYNVVGTVAQLTSIGGVSGADTFNGTQLTIPYVLVGAAPFYNVVLAVGVANLVAVNGGMPGAAADQYDPATGRLTIPAVQVGPRVYTNVVLHIVPADLVSAGVTESVLYSFGAIASGDGYDPEGNLVQASDGNFYGMTLFGGANGYGTVVRITPAGNEEILYSFGTVASGDGQVPHGGTLIQASDGNLYGTTTDGGANKSGTVFRISLGGTESVVWSFGSDTSGDGTSPIGSLIQGSDGALYGMTPTGGKYGAGAVVRITPAGSEEVLCSFDGTPGDGRSPSGALVQASDGNFYAMTGYGGAYDHGAVVRITPAGDEAVIYSFGSNPGDGSFPAGTLIQGSDGNLYGLTPSGGAKGNGAVIRITPAGTESVLYSFGTNGNDGLSPNGSLVQAGDGNFYGMSEYGGANGAGAVFRITPAGNASTVYSFAPGGDGTRPLTSLIQGSDSNLYGVTLQGGANNTGAIVRLNW